MNTDAVATAVGKPDSATAVDVIVSVLLPLIGLVIGLVALAKGQRKRGPTMIGCAVGMAVAVTLLRMG